MEKKFRIVAIAKSDAWFDRREELIGQIYIIREDKGYLSHRGSGWFSAEGDLEKPLFPGGLLLRVFFRVKLAHIREA